MSVKGGWGGGGWRESPPETGGKCRHRGGEGPPACPPSCPPPSRPPGPRRSTEKATGASTALPGGRGCALPCLPAPGCPWLNLTAGSLDCGVSIEPMHSCRNYFLNARCVRRGLQRWGPADWACTGRISFPGQEVAAGEVTWPVLPLGCWDTERPSPSPAFWAGAAVALTLHASWEPDLTFSRAGWWLSNPLPKTSVSIRDEGEGKIACFF